MVGPVGAEFRNTPLETAEFGRHDGWWRCEPLGGGEFSAKLPIGQRTNGIAAVTDGKEGVHIALLEHRGETLLGSSHDIVLPLPLHKDYGRGLLRAIRLQGVAMKDIPLQNKTCGLFAPGPSSPMTELGIVGIRPQS